MSYQDDPLYGKRGGGAVVIVLLLIMLSAFRETIGDAPRCSGHTPARYPHAIRRSLTDTTAATTGNSVRDTDNVHMTFARGG